MTTLVAWRRSCAWARGRLLTAGPSGMDRRRCRRWYREVAVKSCASQLIRPLLTTRAPLVRRRVDPANQIRGVLKPFGLMAGKGGGQSVGHRSSPSFRRARYQPVAELSGARKPIASTSCTLPSAPTLNTCAAGRSNGLYFICLSVESWKVEPSAAFTS